ncbi:hypothetical protein NM688_g1940 [Phlebia brevispora]|uniref:Uncharacterized protein n=1 Tax=Phlebia brevispora TaxID=194682 RepID=A0ACC1TA28_9APHY|nr:hypothetical protein NM688_g1940 [Phlebia brevispora]
MFPSTNISKGERELREVTELTLKYQRWITAENIGDIETAKQLATAILTKFDTCKKDRPFLGILQRRGLAREFRDAAKVALSRAQHITNAFANHATPAPPTTQSAVPDASTAVHMEDTGKPANECPIEDETNDGGSSSGLSSCLERFEIKRSQPCKVRFEDKRLRQDMAALYFADKKPAYIPRFLTRCQSRPQIPSFKDRSDVSQESLNMQTTGDAQSKADQDQEPQCGALRKHELWWRDSQKWLEDKGYMLRPRYQPEWVPSWEGNGRRHLLCEDGAATFYGNLMDATRISDGKMVMLKRISDETHPHELELTLFFSSEAIASNPQNHCVQVLDVLDVPNNPRLHIIVLPFLREFNDPSFQTVGEAIACFSQIFEGLQFMHQHNIAHRDCMDLNIMLDPEPMYPNMFHPVRTRVNKAMNRSAKHYTRTQRPTRYYLIDFGLSDRFDPAKGPPMTLPVWGGDKTVPEFKRDYDARINPFPVDVYYIGNMIQESFLQKYHGLEFLTPLVEIMTQDDSSKRPTIDEVIRSFEETTRKLPWWKPRSRLVKVNERGLCKKLRSTYHLFKTIGYIVSFHSAIPIPSSSL